MAGNEPITREEMVSLFGQSMPIEAVSLLFDSADDITVGEVRSKLRQIAAARRGDQTAWRNVPVTTEFLASLFDAYCGVDGHNLVVQIAANWAKQKL